MPISLGKIQQSFPNELALRKFKKLNVRYCGPYVITKKINDQAYELLLPPHIKVHNVFHVSLLKKYVPDANHILSDELPLGSNNGDLAITHKRVMQSRTRILRNMTLNKYLIKWTGYPKEDATWEREDILLANYPEFMSR